MKTTLPSPIAITCMLEDRYRLYLAPTGEKALTLFRHHREIDLVLLDYRLPDMSGLEVLQNLKSIKPSLPVIFMTAYGSEDVAVKAFTMGAKDYVKKPFTCESFTAKIEFCLSLNASPHRDRAERTVVQPPPGPAAGRDETRSCHQNYYKIQKVNVQFNPVIMGVIAGRSGSDVIFSAQVSDNTETPLSYTWSFNNGLSFADPSANPATLQGYNETVTGLLTLRVANGLGGHTTVSYQINAAQFPATLGSNTLTLPQGLLRIGGGCQMSGSNGSVISLMIDEWMEQADLNNDGDIGDRILGYYDMNSKQVVNLGIAINENISLVGGMMAYTLADTGKLGWYTFSDNTLHEADIVPDTFGRNSSYVSRLVSGTMIAYVAAGKLSIYDTATGGNTVTMESVPDAGSPSFSGNLIAFVGTTGTLRYYDVTTGATTDTGEFGSYPVIDNGTIAYETAEGKVAYYVTATGANIVTPIVNSWPGDGHPSISNNIIAAFVHEGGAYGDLNGDGIIDENSSYLVLYDIPTGRMVSTGVRLCCGVDLNGFVITVCMDMPCSQGFMIMSDVVRQYFGR